MARLYTTKAGTRRWPVAVFYNILDLDLYNILDFTSMRQFVDQLVNMRHIFPAEIFFSSFVLNLVQKVVQHSSEENLSVVGPCRKSKQCQIEKLRSTMNMICLACKKFSCEKCENKKHVIVCRLCKWATGVSCTDNCPRIFVLKYWNSSFNVEQCFNFSQRANNVFRHYRKKKRESGFIEVLSSFKKMLWFNNFR